MSIILWNNVFFDHLNISRWLIPLPTPSTDDIFYVNVVWRECRRSATTGRTSSTRSSHAQWLPTSWLEMSTVSIKMLPSSQLIGPHMSWQSLTWRVGRVRTGSEQRRGIAVHSTSLTHQTDTQVSVQNAFTCQAPREEYLSVPWLDYHELLLTV